MAKIQLKDAKSDTKRYRNILANSGEIMESGEVRDLDSLYVMDRGGKLIKISDLNTNPDEQTEDYAVQAQADHGEVVEGMLIPTIEKQFGSCKVWLEDDGLHARMFFAEGDSLADHAWAISEHASYSIGVDWYPQGYYGTGYEIDQPIGILREISMVLTGNDPRAKTIDHKDAEAVGAKGSEAVEAEDGDNNNNELENTKNDKWKVKFPKKPHIDEILKDRSLASKFIDCVFCLLDTDPLYAGIKLHPSVFYNWVFHLDPEEVKWAKQNFMPERDSEYLDYIRTLPCICCGIQHRSEAHHIRDTRTAGVAIKSPDWYTVPLCHNCHLGVAHGTGWKKSMDWIPLDLIDFCKICYIRWKNKNG